MDRRNFLKTGLIGGVLCFVYNNSNGETIEKQKVEKKRKELVNIIDYFDNGGELSIGMYIAETCKFGNPVEPWTFQLASKYDSTNIIQKRRLGLINVWGCADSDVEVEVKDFFNISKEEICSLIKKQMSKTSFSNGITYEEYCKERGWNYHFRRNWFVLDMEDVANMFWRKSQSEKCRKCENKCKEYLERISK